MPQVTETEEGARVKEITDMAELRRKAYSKGYDRFKDEPGLEDMDEAFDGLMYFKEGATFINTVMPMLREMAGYTDTDAGTFTVHSEVVVEGETVDAHHIHDELVGCWDNGALDAMAGNKRYTQFSPEP